MWNVSAPPLRGQTFFLLDRVIATGRTFRDAHDKFEFVNLRYEIENGYVLVFIWKSLHRTFFYRLEMLRDAAGKLLVFVQG